jgi:murein DD-endopeptidase MepM/ murein hydrolase activator NlpD
MRRVFALVCTLAAIASFAVALGSGPVRADDATEQAARDIADARERANSAADRYFEAVSMLDQLAVDEQNLQADISTLTEQVDALQARVQDIAVSRFTRSSATSSPLLNGFSTPEEQMQVAALSAVIYDTSEDDFDNFKALSRSLGEKRDELDGNKQKAERQQAKAASLRDTATSEVEHLKTVEADRLRSDAVRRAVQAEEARRTAQAAALLAQSGAATTTEAGVFDPASDGGGGAVQTSVPRSSGGAGGQTGGGGAGGRPGGAGGSDYGGPGFVCPTGTSAVAFGDTWGAPRSGGRRHQGVDMIGPIGTPLLAVVDGFAEPKTNTLGGTTIWFKGNDGNRYYYAHLDHYGTLGAVQAGTIIGYMGQTGNARFSVPHLHFEVHPAGGAAVNPYPTVRAHC